MSWNNNPIRRGQLIMPFGPGNLFVSKDGTSMMIAGTDFWFDSASVDVDEFKLHDWRLEAEMNVDHFRLPPDFRTSFSGADNQNIGLQIPSLRFPSYHICSRCKLMRPIPYHQVEHPRCPNCSDRNLAHQMNQARFISICQKGHIQDFPWREWVHKSSNQECKGPLYYNSGQGASMDSISISCGLKNSADGGCGSKENLSSALLRVDKVGSEVQGSSLKDLIKNLDYKCQGLRPWLGEKKVSHCNSPPVATLRGAGNVYFPLTRSSISLPKSEDSHTQSICDEIDERPELNNVLLGAYDCFEDYEENPDERNKDRYEESLKKASNRISGKLISFKDNDLSVIKTAIDLMIRKARPNHAPLPENRGLRDIAFRQEEYKILQKESSIEDLIIEIPDFKDYLGSKIKDSLLEGIDHISLIKKLVETTVLEGFTRFTPSWKDDFKSDLMLEKNKRLINWLPARQSTGEGIFIRFNEVFLQEWEKRKSVLERVENLSKNLDKSDLFKSYEALATPRHVLMHSFAHAMINELTYSSGYGSSALRERLYVSDDPKNPMAGVLIYTASGDSEGSMGGLVMQGRPKTFENLLLRTLTKSSWCSHDPVCAVGKNTGPDSCNNSACYSCCLVPEPSCEFSNAGLDRALLGTRALGYKDIAYFIPHEEKET